MIQILDANLYKPNKNDYLKSLEYANNLKPNNDKNIFHCLWKVPKDFGRKQLAVLKSIIVNHENVEINLWSNVDLTDNSYFCEVKDFVNFKKWNLIEELKGTILENDENLTMQNIEDDYCYLEGDIFRLLILHKYGGFYIDMDVLVLRDMSPLNKLEFLYQWGTSGFNPNEPNLTINGAIMKIDKNSELSVEFLELIKSTPANKNTTAWGNSMYSNIRKNRLLVLPGVWFNSEWGFEGAINNPFVKVDNIDLFEGAFTWHWHNKWDAIIEDGSKFEILEKQINIKFENKKGHFINK